MSSKKGLFGNSGSSSGSASGSSSGGKSEKSKSTTKSSPFDRPEYKTGLAAHVGIQDMQGFGTNSKYFTWKQNDKLKEAQHNPFAERPHALPTTRVGMSSYEAQRREAMREEIAASERMAEEDRKRWYCFANRGSASSNSSSSSSSSKSSSKKK